MITQLLEEWARLGPARWAQDRYGWITEDGGPVVLADWQAAVLDAYWQRRGKVSTLFISTTKKAGKTWLNSALTCFRWLTMPGIHFCLGNDWDQGAMLQAAMIGAMAKRHPVLKRLVQEKRDRLVFVPTGSELHTLPADYSGSAGHNFKTVSFTEIWAFTYEGHVRLWEELTVPPLSSALRIVDSYAGFENESSLLQRVWDRGLSGDLVSETWPIYLTGQQLSYIHQGEDAQARCWRGTEAERLAYYAEQAATLRPGTYNRLHLNQWASSEDAFIMPEQWDALIDASYQLPEPSKAVRLFIAVDIGVKRDHSAVVSVYRDEAGGLRLGPFRVWKPISGQEVDLQAVENYLYDLWLLWGVVSLVGDPSQFLHIKQRLESRGVIVKEFLQTTGNLTEAGNALFDVVRQGRLRVYPGASELRGYVLNARAKETPRGIRLVKDTGSKKIDAAVALAMSVCEAEQNGSSRPATVGNYLHSEEWDRINFANFYN